jgi:hypothetical protein
MLIVGEQRLLGTEVLHSRPEDRPLESIVAQRPQVRRPQRALPHEALLARAPERVATRGALSGLRQRERNPADVIPAGHASTYLAA